MASEVQTNNGVNVAALLAARTALTDAPEAANFTWRATCTWKNGTHSRSTVEGFYGLGEEQKHKTTFTFDADHPDRLAEGVLAALEDRASWPDIRARALRYVQTERSWANSVARYAAVYNRLRSDFSRGAAHRSWNAC